jgi:carotenoid cleavage dioxygenase-like enzyme
MSNKSQKADQKNVARFPKAMFSASREEFFGQDEAHVPIKLTIKKGLTEEEVDLPKDLVGHVFVIGAVGSVDSPRAKDISKRRNGNNGEIEGDRQLCEFTISLAADGLTPIFNGDGMVYRVDFQKTPDVANHQVGDRNDKFIEKKGCAWFANCIVKTPDYYLDQAIYNLCSGKTKHPDIDEEVIKQLKDIRFIDWGLARFSFSLGNRNQLNTAFLPMKFPGQAERLLVTWDTGRPYEIDPYTLATIAPVGNINQWESFIKPKRPQPLEPVMSSAHPVFDPHTGDMFTVNITRTLVNLLKLPRILAFSPKWIGDSVTQTPQYQQQKQRKVFALKALHNFMQNTGTKKQDDHGKQNFLVSWIPKIKARMLLNLIQVLFLVLEPLVNWLLHIYDIDRGEDAIYLVRWNGAESFNKWKVMLPQGSKILQTVHQMGITEKYVVFADTAFKVSPEQFIPGWISDGTLKIVKQIRVLLAYPQSSDTHFYIVPRDRLKQGVASVRAVRVTIPREVAHYEIDYANPNNRVTIYTSNICASDPAEFIRKYDQSVYDLSQETQPANHANNPTNAKNNDFAGMGCAPMDVNLLACYVIDGATGRLLRAPEDSYVYDKERTWAVSLATFHPGRLFTTKQHQDIYWNSWGNWQDLLTNDIYELYENYKYRKIPVQELKDEIAFHGIPSGLSRVQVHHNKTNALPEIQLHPDYFSFPDGCFGNSPTFVPRPNSTDATDGYIVCFVVHSHHLYADPGDPQHNWSNNSEIWIFDAQNLHQGPLYRLSHRKLNFSLTIHTTWLENLASPPAREYDVRQDYQHVVERMKQLQDDPRVAIAIEQLFEQEVYPRYDRLPVMNIAQRVCENVKRFYSTEKRFYIKPGETIFPQDFPPTKGAQPDKGSFFKVSEVICGGDRVAAKVKVHAIVSDPTNSNAEPQEIVVDQNEIWTWNSQGELHFDVEFPDGQGGTFGDFSRAEVPIFNEHQIDLIFTIPLPMVLPNSPASTASCTLQIFQTNLKEQDQIDVYNTLKFIFYNEQNHLIGENELPRYIAYSTNSHAWD